jgi:hypothetical protein
MQNSHNVFKGFLKFVFECYTSSHGRFLQHLKDPSAHGNLPPFKLNNLSCFRDAKGLLPWASPNFWAYALRLQPSN